MEQIEKYLPSVQTNLAPATQESKPPVTGEESQLVAAVQSLSITRAPLEELKEVLRLVMVKLGLRAANWPNEAEKELLIHHILTNYGNHTAKEILLAFEMAIAGNLDADATTYENFSCQYFSSIMNAYRNWAKEAYKQNVKEVPMIEHKEDLSDKAMQDWYESTAAQLRAQQITYDHLPVMIYDWLDKKGEIRLDNKKKFAYMDEAAKRIEIEGGAAEMEKVKTLAKKLVLNDYILKNA
jgi:hypothetical protein